MAGNENSGQRKDKLVRDALMLAVNRVQEGDPQGRRKLALAAAAVVEKAVEGDLAAFKEIADRIDGKAREHITVVEERDVTKWSDEQLKSAIIQDLEAARVAPKGKDKAVTH